MSIQAIIMSEEVYFNEPGYEHEAGTPEGEGKNYAYQNIVKYANIKYAMIEQMKTPTKGFEEIIRKHFWIKKEEIMTEVTQWLDFEPEHKPVYASLVQDHNSKWCQEFTKEENAFKKMMKEAIIELDKTLKGITEESLSGELALNTDVESTWEQDQMTKKKSNKLELTYDE